ncbi:MAG TPA: serpin family protein [Kofleriaceae bacterium]|jgi:serpin B
MRGVVVCLLLAACSSDSGPTEIRSSRAYDKNANASPESMESVVGGNTDLAVKLYKESMQAGGNFVFSPHSISSVFAMLYAGANGETGQQIASTFEFPADVHVARNALDQELAAQAQAAHDMGFPFELKTANSMWGQDGAQFKAPFLDTLAVNYNVGVHVVDYRTDYEGARQQINDWVDDRTEHHILDLLPPGSLDDMTRLVLTNAIYMKAAWKTTFEASETSDLPFHTPTGDVTVPMMRGDMSAAVARTATYTAVQLPYAGSSIAMTIVVPNNLGEFETSFQRGVIEDIQASVTSQELAVRMPKFTLSTNLKLRAALMELGMPKVFTRDAELGGIEGNDRELYVTDALHKGFIAVDESGTTAAAASAVVVGDDSAPEEISVDKPFVFFIHDTVTGEVLFIGRVLNPLEQ